MLTLTRLKDDGVANLDIATIARGLHPLRRADKWAYDKSSLLAKPIKRAKLDSHLSRSEVLAGYDDLDLQSNQSQKSYQTVLALRGELTTRRGFSVTERVAEGA